MPAQQKTTIHIILLMQLGLFNVLSNFCSSTETYNNLIIILDRFQEETCAKSLEQDGYSSTNRPEGIGAITSTLLVALEQQAAPVVTSKSLLNTIYDHTTIFNDFLLEKQQYISKKYGCFKRFSSRELIKQFSIQTNYAYAHYHQVNRSLKKLLFSTSKQEVVKTLKALSSAQEFSQEHAPLLFSQTLTNSYHKTCYNEVSTYMLCALALKRLKSWRMYSLTHDLCVLVPTDFIEAHSKPLELVPNKKGKINNKNYSYLERATGLKIDHLPDFILESNKVNLNRSYEPIALCLKKLFISKHEYTHLGSQAPYWNIYLTGHGSHSTNYTQTKHYYQLLENYYQQRTQENRKNKKALYTKIQTIKAHIKQCEKQTPQGTIATIPLYDFKELLLFFNSQLTINTFFYASCYAGGYHLEVPFTHNAKPLMLNYTVIVGALAESPIKQDVPSLALPPYGQVKTGTHLTIYGITPESINTQKKRLTLTTKLAFSPFFNALSRPLVTKKALVKALRFVHSYQGKKNNLPKDFACNIPWIRCKDTALFKLLLHSKKSCPHYCIATKSGSKSPLVFTHSMPWQILDKPVYLSCLQAPCDTLQDILAALLPLNDLKASRLISIKKLICASSSLKPFSLNEPSTELTHVLICYGVPDGDTLMLNYDSVTVYFTYNSLNYTLVYKNNQIISIRKRSSSPLLAFVT